MKGTDPVTWFQIAQLVIAALPATATVFLAWVALRGIKQTDAQIKLGQEQIREMRAQRRSLIEPQISLHLYRGSTSDNYDDNDVWIYLKNRSAFPAYDISFYTDPVIGPSDLWEHEDVRPPENKQGENFFQSGLLFLGAGEDKHIPWGNQRHILNTAYEQMDGYQQENWNEFDPLEVQATLEYYDHIETFYDRTWPLEVSHIPLYEDAQ